MVTLKALTLRMAEQIARQTCSVCSQQFSEPKILPCCHTFCLRCLEKTVGDSEKKEDIACPQCSKIHAIPVGGLQNFVTDFAIFHEIKASDLTALQKAVCGECEVEGPVESYCRDCQAYLCRECSTQAHKKLRSYRGHKVIPVQELSAATLQSSNVYYCSTHSSEVLKLYCETCRKVVCRECYLVDHHQHSYKPVQDAQKQLRDQLMSLVKDGKEKLAAFKANLGEIQRVETSAARYPEVLKAEINTFFDGVIQSTEKRRQELLTQVDSKCHTDLKQIWAHKAFQQAAIPEAEDALLFADKAVKCTNDIEMIQTALQSIKQLSQLESMKWDASTFINTVRSFWTFRNGTTLETNKAGNIFHNSMNYNVEVSGLYKTELGKTISLIIKPTLYDARSKRNVCLIMKANVRVKYGNSKRVLNAVALTSKSDGSHEASIRLVCGGEYTIEVEYDNEPVSGSPFSLEVTGIPKVEARVRKGPDWKGSKLQVKEGVVKSVKNAFFKGHTVAVLWNDVDGVCEYSWGSHQQGYRYEVELV